MDYDLLTVDMKSRDWNKDRIYLKATAGLYGGSSNSFYRFDSSSLYSYAAGSQEGRHVSTGRTWDLAHRMFTWVNFQMED